MKLNMKGCTLEKLDDLFGLQEVYEIPAVTTWLANRSGRSEYEQQTLKFLQKKLIKYA